MAGRASAGGGLALDTALLAPDRVAGLVLFGTSVSGAPDPARSRELAARLPRARYRALPGIAHEPYLEDPGQVAGLLLGALAGN